MATVNFFPHGGGTGGSAKDAIGYLTGDEKKAREGALVLRGDPALTLEIADSLTFKQKYTSGVISFEEPPDFLSMDQKQAIIDDFHKVLCPGMHERVNLLAVEHTDKGRLEIHFMLPKVDMESGKSFNPYFHRVDCQRIDTWKDAINLEYGLSDPNDVLKRKTTRDIDTFKARWDDPRIEFRKEIDSFLTAQIAGGSIKNRDDVLNALKEQSFTINRAGKDYISIKHPSFEEGEKAIRLKGVIYEQSWTIEKSIEQLTRAENKRDGGVQERDESRISELRTRLDEFCTRKSESNLGKYGRTLEEIVQVGMVNIDRNHSVVRLDDLPDRSDIRLQHTKKEGLPRRVDTAQSEHRGNIQGTVKKDDDQDFKRERWGLDHDTRQGSELSNDSGQGRQSDEQTGILQDTRNQQFDTKRIQKILATPNKIIEDINGRDRSLFSGVFEQISPRVERNFAQNLAKRIGEEQRRHTEKIQIFAGSISQRSGEINKSSSEQLKPSSILAATRAIDQIATAVSDQDRKSRKRKPNFIEQFNEIFREFEAVKYIVRTVTDLVEKMKKMLELQEQKRLERIEELKPKTPSRGMER